MNQPLLTVAVGARYPLDRMALAALITELPGLRVIPLESDPPPQALVWDPGLREPVNLPHLTPETKVLLLVGDMESPTLPPGVVGLFSKDEKPEALGVAIRQVARGEQYLSPSLALALLARSEAEAAAHEFDLSTLTDRERQILALLAQGLSNKAIAARLYLSVRTVEGHLAKLYERLGVHSRVEAVLIAVQQVHSQAIAREHTSP